MTERVGNLVDSDYITWIDGSCLAGKQPKVLMQVVLKVAWALFCCICFVVILPMVPVTALGDAQWLASQPHWWVLVYNQVSMALLRHRYYFAWVLCDAGCNAAGFGYDGENKNGVQKWNRVLNLDVTPA